MKGLLLKDYYLIRSVLWIVLAVFVVVGAAMAFLTTPWALTVVATVILGMISVTTIQMDKASGWRKVAAVLPLSRAAVVDSNSVFAAQRRRLSAGHPGGVRGRPGEKRLRWRNDGHLLLHQPRPGAPFRQRDHSAELFVDRGKEHAIPDFGLSAIGGPFRGERAPVAR